VSQAGPEAVDEALNAVTVSGEMPVLDASRWSCLQDQTAVVVVGKRKAL
jgi:hypothetical protein